jgi:hypothetical protein
MRHWRYLSNLIKSIFAIGILAGAILFVVSYWFTDANPDDLAAAAVVLGTVTLAVALAHKFRLVIWSALTFLAYSAGLVYAIELLLTPDVEGGYRAAVMTVCAFALHGFAAGAFIELVTYLHRVTTRVIEIIKEKTAIKIEKHE